MTSTSDELSDNLEGLNNLEYPQYELLRSFSDFFVFAILGCNAHFMSELRRNS